MNLNNMKSDFGKLYPGDNTFEKKSRITKAKKITSVIFDNDKMASEYRCLDYGCSVGLMTEYFATKFKKVVGADVDKGAIDIATKRKSNLNIKYVIIKNNKVPFPDNYFDAVIFNQVYEHVKKPERSINEIYRILKSGGVCYFGARNKYFPLDGHYTIPFLAFLPKYLSDLFFKYILNRKEYDIRLFSLWQLRKLIRKFELCDYTLNVFRNPKKYYVNNVIKYFYPFAIIFYFLIPNYIWLLKKK